MSLSNICIKHNFIKIAINFATEYTHRCTLRFPRKQNSIRTSIDLNLIQTYTYSHTHDRYLELELLHIPICVPTEPDVSMHTALCICISLADSKYPCVHSSANTHAQCASSIELSPPACVLATTTTSIIWRLWNGGGNDDPLVRSTRLSCECVCVCAIVFR